MLEEFLHQSRIAYFSMEIALQDDIPTYSGGLGVLAGDTIRSAVDLELPLVGVTLISRAGYFRQEIDAAGRQSEQPDTWEPRQWTTATDAKIAVLIEGREVWVRSWLYIVQGHLGGRQPVIDAHSRLRQSVRQHHLGVAGSLRAVAVWGHLWAMQVVVTQPFKQFDGKGLDGGFREWVGHLCFF